MTDIKNTILELSKSFHKEVVTWRRHIHTNPELAFQEYKTAAFVAERLKSFGVEFQDGVAKTGIVATIKGKNPDKKTIALRADMDALPIIEANDVPYKSINNGVMHACGHDVHTSSLLGTAKILSDLSGHFEGTVKLFFQPSEEQYPGGAKVMIEEGVLENPRPVHIFGQHVFPELEAGKVGFKSGDYMASTDELHLTVKGKGGHAAQPARNIDPVLIASHIVVALQQIVSRHNSPEVPTVLSFGRIIGDGQTNIIPDEVKISGTIRTFDEKWRRSAHQKITKMAEAIADGMGGKCEVIVDHGYPFLYNDPEITEKSRQWAKDLLGEHNVIELPIRMTAEDFSYFANEVPSCFYRLGVANQSRGINARLHTSTFDVDEKSLETGMALMSYIAIKALGN